MYTYKPSKDAGILFTALSNYQAVLTKDLKIFNEPEYKSDYFKPLKNEIEQTIKRVTEILEEI